MRPRHVIYGGEGRHARGNGQVSRKGVQTERSKRRRGQHQVPQHVCGENGPKRPTPAGYPVSGHKRERNRVAILRRTAQGVSTQKW
jgi:hypothetical protein